MEAKIRQIQNFIFIPFLLSIIYNVFKLFYFFLKIQNKGKQFLKMDSPLDSTPKNGNSNFIALLVQKICQFKKTHTSLFTWSPSNRSSHGSRTGYLAFRPNITRRSSFAEGANVPCAFWLESQTPSRASHNYSPYVKPLAL